MTQAFNLSQLANKVNTSGQLDASTGLVNTVSVANGGTGTTTPSLVSGTNITISGSWPNQTVTASSGAPTTAQVLSAMAGATQGVVGAYCGGLASGTGVAVGANIAGSSIMGINTSGGFVSSGFAGTWKNMGSSLTGTSPGYSNAVNVWLRIS